MDDLTSHMRHLLGPLAPPLLTAASGQPVIDIPFWKLGLIAVLLTAPLTLAGAAGLHINRPLIIAGARCVVQLLLLGSVLRVIFNHGAIYWVGLYLLFMMTVASVEAGARPSMSYKGMHVHVGLALVLPAFATLLYMLAVIIRPTPLHQPQYAIPLMGMMLGNSLTGVTVGVKTLLETLSAERAAIEWRLCMGATRWEAVSPLVRQVLQTALTPVINMLSVAGLISIPGMLTGQILGGSEPVVAAKYQIMVMFAIAATSAASVGTAVVLAVLRLTDTHHCLRLDRLQTSNYHAGRAVMNQVVTLFQAAKALLLGLAARCGLGPRADDARPSNDNYLLIEGPRSSV
eukprot:jgi/Ulvmu1/246/UM001_0250.1